MGDRMSCCRIGSLQTPAQALGFPGAPLLSLSGFPRRNQQHGTDFRSRANGSFRSTAKECPIQNALSVNIHDEQIELLREQKPGNELMRQPGFNAGLDFAPIKGILRH